MGGEAQYKSCGICAYEGSVTIEDGEVNAEGGTATGDSGISIPLTYDSNSNGAVSYSYGIYADVDVTISGTADVTAMGGEADYESCGISAWNNVTIDGGTITATSGETNAENGESTGIWASYEVTISGGHVTAQTLAESAAVKAALNIKPTLPTTYWWRTAAADAFTASTTPYTYSEKDTDVEIMDTAPTCKVIFDACDGTVAPASKEIEIGAAIGDLPTPTRDGYNFDGWFTAAEGGEKVTTDTVFNGNTTIYAHWTANQYAITVESSGNGSVTADRNTAAIGDTVTLTVAPDKDCKLETLTVTDAAGKTIALTDKGDGKYTFTMPASEVSIKAVFAEIEQPVVHTLTKTEAKAATCTEDGNIEYWTCSDCGKYFSDEDGTTEIEKDGWKINATGHTLTKTIAKAATCTEGGNSEY